MAHDVGHHESLGRGGQGDLKIKEIRTLARLEKGSRIEILLTSRTNAQLDFRCFHSQGRSERHMECVASENKNGCMHEHE